MAGSAGISCLLAVGIVAALLSFGLWRDVQHRGAGSLAGHTTLARRPISASVSPASGVRCSRISLPARYYNATTAPYNPAAMRHPGTGEWYLLHTYDQVRPLAHACAPRRAAKRARCRPLLAEPGHARGGLPAPRRGRSRPRRRCGARWSFRIRAPRASGPAEQRGG
jgi:hypothetical protein